jgi:hypothetical protein
MRLCAAFYSGSSSLSSNRSILVFIIVIIIITFVMPAERSGQGLVANSVRMPQRKSPNKHEDKTNLTKGVALILLLAVKIKMFG